MPITSLPVLSRFETVDADHGRIETRRYTAIHDVEWLRERHDWSGLKSVVMVESQREIDGATTRQTRFYITSLTLEANTVGPMIRDHWSIENSLHWVMDMVFRDDECRVRTENAPANFTTIKHMASNLIRRAPGKGLTAPPTNDRGMAAPSVIRRGLLARGSIICSAATRSA
ncbi:ISAs1 family transposase [Aurantimonas sp. A2-1-M11]|uniref:ISAs1 family transposase n=1 Tax=Aurantimonas sp. A2-1-M11 TaxID=3113712 RepID=UPI002F935CBB